MALLWWGLPGRSARDRDTPECVYLLSRQVGEPAIPKKFFLGVMAFCVALLTFKRIWWDIQGCVVNPISTQHSTVMKPWNDHTNTSYFVKCFRARDNYEKLSWDMKYVCLYVFMGLGKIMALIVRKWAMSYDMEYSYMGWCYKKLQNYETMSWIWISSMCDISIRHRLWMPLCWSIEAYLKQNSQDSIEISGVEIKIFSIAIWITSS